MKRVARFEKVSYEQFKKDFLVCFPDYLMNETAIQNIYNSIKLPQRATIGSAGYDFYCPIDVNINTDSPVVIPTGIRAKIENGWVLKLYPRSGMGFKFGFELLNTVGIIDSDYYNSNNEGHIMAKVNHTHGDDKMSIEKNKAFVQGVFVEYGITEDDDAEGIRNGGFGSTSK